MFLVKQLKTVNAYGSRIIKALHMFTHQCCKSEELFHSYSPSAVKYLAKAGCGQGFVKDQEIQGE